VPDAWGFTEKSILTWAKDRMGLGDWLRGQTEHCILAVRGRPLVELTNQTTLLHGRVRAHSEKPLEFYCLVENLCPAPRYAYLFSRYQHNDRWDCHGDEAPRCGRDGVNAGEKIEETLGELAPHLPAEQFEVLKAAEESERQLLRTMIGQVTTSRAAS
jgi:N6-adenosine-specific RNA methylase IME4